MSDTLDDQLRVAAAAPARVGSAAHPILAFVVALGGLGVTVAEICVMCGSSIDAGPVLAACRIRYHRPMQVSTDYTVDGSITRIVRKASRRFGAADHVDLAMDVASGAEAFARVELTWIMPRGVEG